jgi:DNA polymerase
VDGKERLRRYLEQRRETGERELVLDAMTVDDVMRIVGARAGASSGAPAGVPAGAPAASRAGAAPADPAGSPATGPAVPAAPVPVEPDAPAVTSGDWRTVLSAAAERDVAIPRTAEPAAVTPPPRRAGPPAPETMPHEKPAAEVPSAEVPAAEVPSAEASADQAPAPLWAAGISVGEASSELFGGPLSAYQSLDALAGAIAKCTSCSLYSTATNPVPGEGSPVAQLVCVGEAPGATEDATGRPFVGQAGKLLDKILAAIQLGREDVFICNVLKHRPPGNRNPLPTEVTACSPYLVRQLELIRPRAILAFGTFAAQTLLQTPLTIGKLRGAVHRYYGVPLIVTYHPAALLRNPAWKRPTWEDVQYARRILDGTGR